MENEDSCLDDFKKYYLEIQKDFSLPSFEELNKDFAIERIAEQDTESVLREIRKLIADKFGSYLKLIESILNPAGSSMLIFSILKSINSAEKETLSEVYKKLAKNEIDLIELDIDSSEDKEAKFIINSFNLWQALKPELLGVTKVIQENWDNKFETNNKNYFS